MVLGIAAITSSQSAYAGKGTRNFVYGALAGVAGIGVLNSLYGGPYYNRGSYYNRGYGYYNSGYRYRRHNYYYGNSNYYSRPYYRPYRTVYRRGGYPAYYAPRRVYRGRPAAWTPAWYRYCASKYRTFRRSDGTFQPYKGGRRLCR